MFSQIQFCSRIIPISFSGSSRHLTFEELSRVLRETGLKNVSSVELRALFSACDPKGDGTVDYEDWLSLLRPRLSPQRIAMVRNTWSRIFGEDVRLVKPSDIADCYDANRHPGVVAGKRTAEAVHREFLDTFDVGDDIPGAATAADFEKYQANVSATVAADDDFDLLLRSVWQPSQQEENDDDDDGTVEEQAPRPNPPRPSLATLARRGLRREPTKISEAAGCVPGERLTVKDAMGGASPQGPLDPTASLRAQRKFRERKAKAGDLRDVVGVGRLLLDVRRQLAAHGARGIVGLARIFRTMANGTSLSLGQFRAATRETGMLELTDAEVRLLFGQLDADNAGAIDYEEFLCAIRGDMNERRRRIVLRAFDALDADAAGAIDPSTIAARFDASRHPDVLGGKLSADDVYREFLDTFDVSGNNDDHQVTSREFLHYYENVSATIDDDDTFELVLQSVWQVPDSASGGPRHNQLRVLVTQADGSQSLEVLDNDVGLQLPRDNVEILRRLRAHGLVGAVAVAPAYCKNDNDASRIMPRTFREVAQTRAAGGGGKVVHATGKKHLGYSGPGLFSSQISLAPSSDEQQHKKQQRSLADLSSSAAGGGPGAGGGKRRDQRYFSSFSESAKETTNTVNSYKNKNGANDVFHSVLGSDMHERRHALGSPTESTSSSVVPTQGSLGVALKRRDAYDVMDKVRSAVRSQGARGMAGLGRKFRILDDRGSGTLSRNDFISALADCAVDLSVDDAGALVAAFGDDRAEAIDYEHFIYSLRGPLSDRRRDLVDEAFHALDADDSGLVDIDDLVNKFDTSLHPDAISGRKTPNDVLHEFLDTFEVGGDYDGKVSSREFQEYYHNVSAAVDDDDYFELMIRAFHVSSPLTLFPQVTPGTSRTAP